MTTWKASGSGGGGRIAIYSNDDNHTGSVTVNGGSAVYVSETAGSAGSIVTGSLI